MDKKPFYIVIFILFYSCATVQDINSVDYCTLIEQILKHEDFQNNYKELFYGEKKNYLFYNNIGDSQSCTDIQINGTYFSFVNTDKKQIIPPKYTPNPKDEFIIYLLHYGEDNKGLKMNKKDVAIHFIFLPTNGTVVGIFKKKGKEYFLYSLAFGAF